MNSKQLNFFLIPEDLPDVYDFFSGHKVKYGRIIEGTSDEITFESFPFKHGMPYEQIYLTTEDFHSNIFLKKGKILPEFSVDIDKSYILQFTPGGFYPASSHVLHRGGFYCATSYFVSNGESVAKSNEFKTWVDKLFKSFKKEFLSKLNDKDRIFLSLRTIEWMKKTGAVIDLAFTKLTL